MPQHDMDGGMRRPNPPQMRQSGKPQITQSCTPQITQSRTPPMKKSRAPHIDKEQFGHFCGHLLRLARNKAMHANIKAAIKNACNIETGFTVRAIAIKGVMTKPISTA
jgi:hypothetical protein